MGKGLSIWVHQFLGIYTARGAFWLVRREARFGHERRRTSRHPDRPSGRPFQPSLAALPAEIGQGKPLGWVH